MAITIEKTLPNGVPLSYYRIVSLTTVVNKQTTIELAGYVSEGARKAEQDAQAEAQESGQFPAIDVYIDTQYIVVDYDPDMSVTKAYQLLKETEGFEDAEDVIDQWSANMAYFVGDTVVHDGSEYECIQSHTSQAGWEPPNVHALWKAEGGDGVPVWSQPDSTNAYNTGDKVHYPDADGPIYESTVDGNVWSPEAYPQGWQLVEGGE